MKQLFNQKRFEELRELNHTNQQTYAMFEEYECLKFWRQEFLNYGKI